MQLEGLSLRDALAGVHHCTGRRFDVSYGGPHETFHRPQIPLSFGTDIPLLEQIATAWNAQVPHNPIVITSIGPNASRVRTPNTTTPCAADLLPGIVDLETFLDDPSCRQDYYFSTLEPTEFAWTEPARRVGIVEFLSDLGAARGETTFSICGPDLGGRDRCSLRLYHGGFAVYGRSALQDHLPEGATVCNVQRGPTVTATD